MKHDGKTSFTSAWLTTIESILKDRVVLLLLLVAPVVYAFFYPWPYALQTVSRVPVMVVDQDHTNLSRQITRWAAANPRIEVRAITGSEQEAQQALWRGEIEGYAIVPADLKRKVLRGQPAVVTIAANGAYTLINKAVLYGFSEAIGSLSAGIEIKKLQASGQSALQARATRSPVNTQMVALFNPTEGYGSYVVVAVALLIIQQTLLMGTAMMVGTLVEADQHRAGVATWLGRILGLSTFGFLSGLFYFGWVFLIQDYPRGANPWGALVLILIYIPTICTIGALLGVWFGNRERGMQALLFTTLPMVFLSGFSWPAEALPWPLLGLRWLFPSTAGIQASLHLNQMAASVSEVWAYLACLLGLTFVAGSVLLGCTRPKA